MPASGNSQLVSRRWHSGGGLWLQSGNCGGDRLKERGESRAFRKALKVVISNKREEAAADFRPADGLCAKSQITVGASGTMKFERFLRLLLQRR
jgi:hypothetical protein